MQPSSQDLGKPARLITASSSIPSKTWSPNYPDDTRTFGGASVTGLEMTAAGECGTGEMDRMDSCSV